MKASTPASRSSGADAASFASSSRLTFCSWRTFPKSNERRNDPSVEGARIPANRSPIAPCRSSSRSSMLSAPAAMPATIAGIFRCGLAPHGRPILTFS